MFIPGNLWSNPSYRVSFSFENKAVYCHSERSEESSGIYYEDKKNCLIFCPIHSFCNFVKI